MHALVKVLECVTGSDALQAFSTPEEACRWRNVSDAFKVCDGCMRNGQRVDASSAVPIIPVPGGGCRGDEWRTLASWEQALRRQERARMSTPINEAEDRNRG